MKEVALLYFSKSNTRQVKVSFIFTEHGFHNKHIYFSAAKVVFHII